MVTADELRSLVQAAYQPFWDAWWLEHKDALEKAMIDSATMGDSSVLRQFDLPKLESVEKYTFYLQKIEDTATTLYPGCKVSCILCDWGKKGQIHVSWK